MLRCPCLATKVCKYLELDIESDIMNTLGSLSSRVFGLPHVEDFPLMPMLAESEG
jgi:hypothetical protein